MAKIDRTDPVKMLAWYDVKGVEDAQLARIFKCSVGDLAEVRGGDEYKDHLQEETQLAISQAMDTDDQWNLLENRALGTLTDSVDSIVDPRLLLGIAVQANKASRRGGQINPQDQKSKAIAVDTLTGHTGVVRLRTRFMERLASDAGVTRIIERQVEITQSSLLAHNDSMGPSEVRNLLNTHLGIDTSNLEASKRFGPDNHHDLTGFFDEVKV
jgi:hypothetical protein